MNFQKVRLSAGLYFVATPIGTARDITLRALDVLASADVIAAEDTRSLRRLMEIHGVPLEGRRILAYHDHSGAGARVVRFWMHCAEGKSVAYASEAGMPLIADPGYDLGRQAAEAGPYCDLRAGSFGSVDGIDAGWIADRCILLRWFFAECIRRPPLAYRGVARHAQGRWCSTNRRNGSRLACRIWPRFLGGNRQAAMCRELTKKFEEVRRGSLEELAAGLAGANGQRRDRCARGPGSFGNC